MTTVIRHSVPELRAGLRRIASERRARVPVDPVQEELVLAGLACQRGDGSIELTRAGHRYL